jgi:Ribonuclease G/E
MVLSRRPSQFAFGSILARHRGLRARNDTGVIYVGLGDQFDDDRRLVRETVLKASSTRSSFEGQPRWTSSDRW